MFGVLGVLLVCWLMVVVVVYCVFVLCIFMFTFLFVESVFLVDC